eukprot:TRINITY_DN7519_c0_g1_i1.p1 TRINITY_DN7519_c0_g1~~TRINITY_DN7519_c0_g1_i1.p1  ORF type:complete len:129 (+),score=11.51 TRINITY_DN7519_c0_g1_i1:107-493(+)
MKRWLRQKPYKSPLGFAERQSTTMICGLTPNSGLCNECYTNSSHEGHEFFFRKGYIGCCDCGDPDAWKPSGNCTKHKGYDESKEKDSVSIAEQQFAYHSWKRKKAKSHVTHSQCTTLNAKAVEDYILD